MHQLNNTAFTVLDPVIKCQLYKAQQRDGQVTNLASRADAESMTRLALSQGSQHC